MTDDLKRVRVHVSGKVQGVFFRDSARSKAEELGVAGWAENLPDGRVELVAEGPSDAVKAMVDWSRTGPESASVRDVQVEDEEPENLSGFEAR